MKGVILFWFLFFLFLSVIFILSVFMTKKRTYKQHLSVSKTCMKLK